MSSEEATTTEVMRMEQPERMDVSVALVEAEARAKLMKAILPQLVAVCHKDNILTMGDGEKSKPYITNDGCQKIARIAGISFGKPEVVTSYEDMPAEREERWEDSGKIRKAARPARRVYIVEVQGEASLLGQTITEFGGASSEDGFFNRPKESPIEIRLEVRKKAMANWQGRCVRTLLGLQGLSWEDLEKTNEFRREDAAGVTYKTGKYSSQKDATADADAADENRRKIREQIFADVMGNAEAGADLLEVSTAFTGKDGKEIPGVRHTDKLGEGRARTTWNKIKPGGSERDQYEERMWNLRDKYGIAPEDKE